MPDCPSGQWERTVNPSACAYVGSNPTSGTDNTHRSYFGGCFLHSPGWLAAGRLAKTVVLRWASWGFDRAGPTNQQFLSRGAGGSWAPLRGGDRNRWFAKPVLGFCGATPTNQRKRSRGRSARPALQCWMSAQPGRLTKTVVLQNLSWDFVKPPLTNQQFWSRDHVPGHSPILHGQVCLDVPAVALAGDVAPAHRA